ncbi:hypothetical protein GCM10010309_61400 [Streptomyces violaceochromogenes]|nr:hypothetical protein GCM10010309_61400 [Streptomyces violaceochromogenes]
MSVVIGTPAGRPSSVATSAGPWDSPAVSQRNLLNGAPQCSRSGTALRTRLVAYGDGATGCAARSAISDPPTPGPFARRPVHQADAFADGPSP